MKRDGTTRRGGVSRRRPVRRADRRDRRAPGRCAAVRAARRCATRSRRSFVSIETGDDRRSRGVRHRVGRRIRTRQLTRSTASSRSTWTRAASRARGRRSSTTSTARRPKRSDARRRRAVVRGPDAVGSEMPQADVVGVTASAIDVVIETGESGPMTPIGINLPNDQAHSRDSTAASRCRSRTSTRRTTSRAAGVSPRVLLVDGGGRRAEKWGAFAGELTTPFMRCSATDRAASPSI